jgi:hypothetical protein
VNFHRVRHRLNAGPSPGIDREKAHRRSTVPVFDCDRRTIPAEAQTCGWLGRKVAQATRRLDGRWRSLDWRWSRPFWCDADEERDPPWSVPSRACRLVGISGHPSWLIALPFLLLAAIVLGPTLELDHAGRSQSAIVWALVAVMVLKLFEWRGWSETRGFLAQAGLLGAAAAAVYLAADRATREADPDIYQHVVLLIVAITLASPWPPSSPWDFCTATAARFSRRCRRSSCSGSPSASITPREACPTRSWWCR